MGSVRCFAAPIFHGDDGCVTVLRQQDGDPAKNSCPCPRTGLYTPRFPKKSVVLTTARAGTRASKRILLNGQHASHAQGDRRLAGRQHRALLRADRAVLRAASARGEGDRRRRGGAGHQGHGSDHDRPADARGDRAGREGSEPPAEAVGPEGARAGIEAQGAALHAAVEAPGPAQRHPVAGAQPSRAEGCADLAPGRHHQVDHRADPRPEALERRRTWCRWIR